jgi:hypothetical protein
VFPGAIADDSVENVEFDRFGFTLVTAAQVGRAIVRGARLRTPEVFLGIGDAAVAHWNDFLPGTIDTAAELLRRRFEAAAESRASLV